LRIRESRRADVSTNLRRYEASSDLAIDTNWVHTLVESTSMCGQFDGS
jgi:hypothetical protein